MEATEATATARYVRMAPRKVRFVLDTIRGKYAQEALDILRFTSNHAADEIANVVKSAMANAVENHRMSGDYLKIARCYVDVGPTMKRVQPRAQGRAYRILKRTSHITVVVQEGTAPPVTRPRELEIKKRGPKPPLRAALPGATVAVTAPAEIAAEAEPVVEEVTTAPAAEATAPAEDTAPAEATSAEAPASDEGKAE
jgi:large subunit ribosomal protein L22